MMHDSSTPTKSPGLTGLVLAGGRSRRLGRDKVVLPVSGRCMLEHMVDLLGPVCDRVWVSGRDAGSVGLGAPLHLEWVPDEVTGKGPLAGILTGLRKARGPVLAVACDLPLLDLATLEKLVAAWRNKPDNLVMTTYLQQETGFIESLVAIYDPAAEPLLANALERGRCKISAAIPEHLRCHIPYSLNDSQVFFNVNYPSDLAVLRRLGLVEETEP
ncbi:molybdenum cofactor guanylyltransferase [Oceanidesulfovibrio marinus]|nr:molybdenum cofactor guanylyltransferase [Oceanidesulfovibrio marinus]